MVIAAVPKRYLENVFFRVIEGNSSFCARSTEETVSKLLHGIARDRIPRSRSFFMLSRWERDSLNDRLDVCDTSTSDLTNRPQKNDYWRLQFAEVTIRTTWSVVSLILLLKNWEKIFVLNTRNWLSVCTIHYAEDPFPINLFNILAFNLLWYLLKCFRVSLENSRGIA